ncbi:MAG: hypothetical protein ABIN96_14070 [Rubrivivax sp.]
MASSSITGVTRAPQRPEGTDIDALGPSDTSDSGSDVQGEQTMATSPANPGEWGATTSKHGSDSDSMGTGARGSAAGPDDDASDIRPDRIIRNPGIDGESDADAPLGDEDARNLSVLGVEDPTDGEDEDEDPVGG